MPSRRSRSLSARAAIFPTPSFPARRALEGYSSSFGLGSSPALMDSCAQDVGQVQDRRRRRLGKADLAL